MQSEETTIVPHSRDAEERLIGSAIIDPVLLKTLDVKPDEFYVHRNRWVWEALLELDRQGLQPDYVSLVEQLEKDGHLEEVGGAAHVAGLVKHTPSALHSEQYASIIHDKYRRRLMLQSASALAKAAYDPGSDIDNAINGSSESLRFNISGKDDPKPIGHYAGLVYDKAVERSENPTDVWGYRTGFVDVDLYTGGLQPGEVFYIAGEPAVGKSKLMMQMALALGTQAPGMVVSMEMDAVALVRRAISAIGNLPTRKIKSGRFDDGDWELFTRNVDEISQYPIQVWDKQGITVLELRNMLHRYRITHDIKWYVLDYLLLMGGNDGLDDTERSAKLSTGVRAVTRELGLAGITVNSVLKEAMDSGKFGNALVRGSGQVIHDADVITFLTKDKDIQSDIGTVVNLSFTKGREIDRPGARVRLIAMHSIPLFLEMAKTAQTLDAPLSGNGRQDWVTEAYD